MRHCRSAWQLAALTWSTDLSVTASSPSVSSPLPPTPPGQCVVQNNATFGGGNLFGAMECPPPWIHTNAMDYANLTDCQMCHETSGCVYWTFSLNGLVIAVRLTTHPPSRSASGLLRASVVPPCV